MEAAKKSGRRARLSPWPSVMERWWGDVMVSPADFVRLSAAVVR
jgi:hypothetical protein